MRYGVFRRFLVAAVLAWSVGAVADDASALIAEGEARLKEGKIEAGIATLQQAVAADPGSSLARTRLGGAQVLHQDYDAGIESFQRAIGLDGKNADAFVGMAIAYLHTGRYPLARAALEEAKRIDPSKQERVDELIAWIDVRTGQGAR
jgi:cytochrome c-type biogenesis protein CcmH/NrfG